MTTVALRRSVSETMNGQLARELELSSTTQASLAHFDLGECEPLLNAPKLSRSYGVRHMRTQGDHRPSTGRAKGAAAFKVVSV